MMDTNSQQSAELTQTLVRLIGYEREAYSGDTKIYIFHSIF